MTATEKQTRYELAALLPDAERIMEDLNALSIRMGKIYPTAKAYYATNMAWHNMDAACRELSKQTE